jgi:hypothetical protein
MIQLNTVAAGSSASPRPPRHLLGRNDQDLPAHFPDKLAQIVEQVIDLRVAHISNSGPTCRVVKPAGNMALKLDQQRRDPPGGGRSSNLSQVVTTELIGLSHCELVGQFRRLPDTADRGLARHVPEVHRWAGHRD